MAGLTLRKEMIEEIKSRYRLIVPRVFSAMLRLPRESFVGTGYCDLAYKDKTLPIGFGQTLSQPYTVAFMTHLLKLKGSEKVLEIGTGSGYQAAVLSKLAKKVYTLEIIASLAMQAKKIFKSLKLKNIFVKAGSGEYGWKEKAPFDAVIITAGVKGQIPKELFEQLKIGGKLVAPVGSGADKIMTRFTKVSEGNVKREEFGIFNFVPFVRGAN